MRGRKPKPTATKQLAGNPGKRSLNEREPAFRAPAAAPYAPRFLNAEGKREWRRVVGMLAEAGVFTAADWAALAMYCQAWGRWVIAERELKRSGGEILGPSANGYLYQNPWRYEANKAFEQACKMMVEFGMTPSSRSRIKVGAPRDEPTFADQLSMWVSEALQERDG